VFFYASKHNLVHKVYGRELMGLLFVEHIFRPLRIIFPRKCAAFVFIPGNNFIRAKGQAQVLSIFNTFYTDGFIVFVMEVYYSSVGRFNYK